MKTSDGTGTIFLREIISTFAMQEKADVAILFYRTLIKFEII